MAVRDMRILVKMVNSLRIKQRTSALDSMHFITLLQQQFCQICTVLAGDARD